MSRLFVSVVEPTAQRAIEKIASLPESIGGVELRVDTFSRPGAELDLGALRNSTSKPMMYTRRAREKSERATTEELFAAAAAGFDLVDVEVAVDYDAVDFGWIPGISSFIGSWGEKIVVSYHDWTGMPEGLDAIVDQLTAWDYKLALTPKSFDDNLKILGNLQRVAASRGTTIFGMGAAGLYSRILAPFFGSDYIFVAADAASVAAPGQLTLEQAQAIFGDVSALQQPTAIFAVVGSPASHSRSPQIHNSLFRRRGVPAAYSLIETDKPRRIFEGLAAGEPLLPQGISITAPFKQEAFAFAQEWGAEFSPRALRSGAVNTLARRADGSLLADNTDVAGFELLLRDVPARSAVVVGAGGTARAALVALERLGIRATVVNRTAHTGALLGGAFSAEFNDLSALPSLRADVIIDTLPVGAGVTLPDSLTAQATVIVADYSAPRTTNARRVIDGHALLEAQVLEQNDLFIASLREPRARK